MTGLRHYKSQKQTNYSLKINIISGVAPHMVGLGGVNWSSTWGSVLGCWGHNGDFYLLCFWRKFPLQKETQWQKIHLPTNPWNRKMLTIVIIPQTPNCMWFTNFTFTDGEVSLLQIWRTKLSLIKKLNLGSLAWVASDLQRRLPWLRLHQGPSLEITRLSQNIQVTLCYLGRVILTLNWKLW